MIEKNARFLIKFKYIICAVISIQSIVLTVAHPSLLNNHVEENVPEVLHFTSEQTFMEKFGDNEKIAEIFRNSSKLKPDPTIPGDMGLPVIIEDSSEELKEIINQGKKIYGYNKYVSDLIPVKRRLPEHRGEWCFTPNRFITTLLPTSVIMCFYNEALSVLLRSIHSVLDRSPSHLLSEIVLIDDFSDHEDLKEKLEAEIRNLTKVKLIRLPQREGLIRARLIGFEQAIAPTITFLDSHIEVSEGWLEPLLDTVTRNWKTIACPIMDHIDQETFSYNSSGEYVTNVGGFSWDIQYMGKVVSESDKIGVKTPADSIASPTMPGGLFSIHRDFFEYLGKYDEQFEIWGAENMELSFKAWMCGGRIEAVPCSHIAHLERTIPTYSREHSKINTARLVAVWLDEYAELYYAKYPQAREGFGDISSRLELKKKLNCASFDWYMNNVVPDEFNPKKSIAYGEVKNLDSTKENNEASNCLDSGLGAMYWTCTGHGGNQNFHYTVKGEIRKDGKCLDYSGGENLVMYECHGILKGNQAWEYHEDTGVIVHEITGLCLTLEESVGKVIMAPCSGERKQKWKFQHDTFFENLRAFDFSSLSEPRDELLINGN